MTNQEKAGAAAMRCMHVTPEPATAVIFTLILLLWRAASGYQLVLPWARLFPRTRTRERSTAIIAGQNFSQMDAGCRWISARHGRIQGWQTTISAIIRPIVSS